MRLSGSGAVTMPYQPLVYVYRPSVQSSIDTNSSTPTTVDFTTTKHNVGGHYNISNNRFTAPVTGIYEFYYSFSTLQDQPSVYRLFLWKNGTQQVETQLRNDSKSNSGNYLMGSMKVYMQMNANQYMELRLSIDSHSGGVYQLYGDSSLHPKLLIRLVQ
jgi:hypothetical protein